MFGNPITSPFSETTKGDARGLLDAQLRLDNVLGSAAEVEVIWTTTGYWLFNARVSYETPNWSVAIWGKNLANKYYYNYGLNINIFGLDYLNRGTPRTYGVELTARF